MAPTEQHNSRLREPLYRVADEIEEVARRADAPGDLSTGIRPAMRAGARALEAHMDAVASRGGMAGHFRLDQPRLLPALEHLEGSFAALLVELWETRSDDLDQTSRAEIASRLERLASRLRRAADEEVDLLYESFNEPASLD